MLSPHDSMPNAARSSKEAALDTVTYVQVNVGGSDFLLPIEEVREVSESLPLRPMPIEIPGCLGVVNLRGVVVPVICLGALTGGSFSLPKGGGRLVFLMDPEGDGFAIAVDGVRKVALPRKEVESGETVTLAGRPAKRITRSKIWESLR